MSQRFLRLGLSLVVLVGVACDDSDEQCSTEPAQVFSITVFDNEAPLTGVVALQVERTGTGLDSTTMGAPWAGQDECRFPYRLPPILANQAGGTITATAYDENFEVLGSGSVTLPWQDNMDGCVVKLSADGVAEIELQ